MEPVSFSIMHKHRGVYIPDFQFIIIVREIELFVKYSLRPVLPNQIQVCELPVAIKLHFPINHF